MLSSIALGAMLVAATLVTTLRAMKLRTLMSVSVVFDLVFSAVALVSFAGSFAGLIVATSAGLMMAVTLTITRAFCGYDMIRPKRNRRSALGWSLVKVRVPGWAARRSAAV